MVRGVGFYPLSEWKAAIGFDAPWVLSPQEVHRLARALQPQSEVAIDGSLRRLAGYSSLKLQTPQDEHFHRIYKAEHSSRRDKVLLHLYDLSASDDKHAEAKAQREFEALRRLQLYQWAPRILDSYQEAPGYAGEMFFFTVIDPAAPSIADRAADETWTTTNRVAFARNAVQALARMHDAGMDNEHFVHRNLTPKSILVRFDNSPIFTRFEYSRIPTEVTIASSQIRIEEYSSIIPPEVQAHGLALADSRSDIYSLCACLRSMFNNDDDLSRSVTERLVAGLAEQPELRSTLADLNKSLSELIGEETPIPPAPPARFWTEDQVIRFRDRDYRIISRLGSGGIGTTFKVIERDRSTKEDVGTYVAKVANSAETGRRVLRAYCLPRSHLRHSALSSIFEVASEWQENQFTALMTWISGAPLADFIGVFSLLADDQQEPTVEALALRWIRVACEALAVLHENGLIHGDVSPRNLIVSGSNLVLTDYDFVCKIGDELKAPATVSYCSPSYEFRLGASPSDDIYSIAASFFHVVFDKQPFRHDLGLDKKRGLNWDGVAREQCPTLAAFLDRATHPDPKRRFGVVAEILRAAQRLFADRGYADTSVRAVVAKARVNQASINYHFGGKDGLYREVLRATIRALTEQQLAHAEEMKGMPRENALAEFIKYQLRPLAARDEIGRHFRIFNWEAVRPTAIYRKLMSEEATPFLSFAVDLMRRFMPKADHRTLTMAAIWLVGQCTVFVRNREQLANPPVSLYLDDAAVEGLTSSYKRVGARRTSGRGTWGSTERHGVERAIASGRVSATQADW